MKTRLDILLTAFVFVLSSCTPLLASTPSPVPTIYPTTKFTPTLTTTSTSAPTITLIPTNTPKPIPSLTLTPEGGYPQIYIGISPDFVDWFGCSGEGIITMDYDPEKGSIMNFWEYYPEVPKQENAFFRTRDGRGNMDICIIPGNPIIFQMEEGKVVENRIDRIGDNMVVLDILVTKGYGLGMNLIYAHLNPDLNMSTDKIESLLSGDIVRQGDLLGYTNKEMVQKYSVLNFGIIYNKAPKNEQGVNGFGYWQKQEMCYIGFDGQVNLIKSTKNE